MRLSLATRIFLAFTAMLVMFGIVLTLTSYQTRAVYDEVELINYGYAPLTLALNDVRNDLRSYNVVLAEEDREVLRKTLAASRDLYNFPEQIDIKLRRAEQHIARVLELPLEDGERQFLEELQADLSETRRLNGTFQERSDEFADAVLSGTVSTEQLQSDLRRTQRRLDTRLRSSQQAVRDEIDAALIRAQHAEGRSLAATVLLSVIALLLAGGIMLLIHLTMRPLRRLTEGAKRVAGGEYPDIQPVRSRDEVGVLSTEFSAMIARLKERDAALREQAAELAAANRHLTALQNFNEDILNSVRSAIITVDRQGAISSANRAALSVFGSDLLGRSAASMLPLAGLTDSAEELRGVLEHKVATTFESVSLALPSGKTALFDLSLSPLHAVARGDGGSAGAIIVCIDVTERVRTKEALIKSERLAAVGELAAKVTHELRNPLSTIQLNTEMLFDELGERGLAAESEPMDTLRSIGDEVQRLTDLTEEYLRFARMPDSRPEEGDIGSFVEGVVDFTRDDLERRGIDIRFSAAPALPAVAIDERQLRRALVNLLLNARQALDEVEHDGRIDVTVSSSDTKADHVEIVIRDNGCGIPDADRPRLFEPFFSTKSQGTGLGLPLVLQILEEHGGGIAVDSRVGVGTTFVVTLPVARRRLPTSPEVPRLTGPRAPAAVERRSSDATSANRDTDTSVIS